MLAAVQAFAAFTPDKDSHGELEVAGVRALWKIDAYDRDLQFASPDPTEPTVTVRLLTVSRSGAGEIRKQLRQRALGRPCLVAER